MPLPSKAVLAALLSFGAASALSAQTRPPPDVPPGEGPRGTSQAAPGQERYDEVGYATVEPVGGGNGVAVAGRGLAVGSFVEVTSLDSGRTIAAMVAAPGPSAPGRLVALSPAAAQALGIAGDTPASVRVRAITPGPADQVALRGGKAGGERLDAPPLLLTALRKRLQPLAPAPAPSPDPARPVAAPARPVPSAAKPPAPRPTPVVASGMPAKAVPAAPAARPTATRAPGRRSGWRDLNHEAGIDRAALQARADALAAAGRGIVVPGNGLYRVRVGPYRDQHGASAARAALAGKGYRDARVVSDR
jgi:rare lipoprotein A